VRKDLIQKYNVPGPRYTSYPTVPYWNTETINNVEWQDMVIRSFEESNELGLSIYIHLPFCEQLCTFCACIKHITKRHELEDPYLKSLLKEWSIYLELLPSTPNIKEVHLGGGTPTFFHPVNLRRLLEGIFDTANLLPSFELSFEGHPNNTSLEHLSTLYDLGSRRVSFGVQDYDVTVQHAINRIQPFEAVKQVHEWATQLGYASISHDLVFGLPHQNAAKVKSTIEKTNALRPDRIAYYSYAHVPWIKNVGQRGFSEQDLPSGKEKRELYEIGKRMFEENGYLEIGMDHFALPHDSLSKAMLEGFLHRNFMGYTAQHTQLMIGLGMSSISDSWYAFSQNVKKLGDYQSLIDQGRLPQLRGHRLSTSDLIVRKHILNLMCQFETFWDQSGQDFAELGDCLQDLEEMEKDGLVHLLPNGLKITQAGRPFVRNVCMAFDLHLRRHKPETRIFSLTV